MSSTRQHLLGYLLGALEPADMAAVERYLEDNPQLRSDLASIEASLAPLGFPDREDYVEQDGPPDGLAQRTCEFVDDARTDLVPRGEAVPAHIAAAMSTAGGRRLRLADVVVTASVLLAAVSLLVPALYSSIEASRTTACQNNLRQIGLALATSASYCPEGRIPAVPPEGNRSSAGIYGVLLQEQQLLDDPRLLVCPSSDLAVEADAFRIPRLHEIDRAAGEALVRLQRRMGGSFAYNLGYLENGKLRAPQHENRSHYALMSDAPATFSPRKTRNHGGRGQNILYEDGHVQWVVDPQGELGDDPFLNRSGLVAAGLDCSDIVLGESLAKPLPVLFAPTAP